MELSDQKTMGKNDTQKPNKFVVKATPEQAKLYDFVSQRKNLKQTTAWLWTFTMRVLESIGHLVKGCLGGGIVAIHESYKTCGLFSALVLTFILGILLSYCIYILVRSAQKMYGRFQLPVMSYPDVAEAACAISPWKPLRSFQKFGRYCVDVTIGLDLFGSCVVYMVVIARTLKQLVLHTNEANDDGIRYYLLALVIPCILITWILELKYLAPFSIVADFFIVAVVIATIVYGSQAATHSPIDTEQFPIFNNIGGMFVFMGAVIFSMEGVGVSMAIENHMTQPKKFPLVLMGAMTIVISMVALVGFFGFWGFGYQAKSPVTLNFPWSWVSIILKVFMALMIYVTFALNFWVPFDLLWYYLQKKHPVTKHWIWARVYRSISVIVILMIALIFPNVSSFIGLIGAFCLSNMGFMYPAVIELIVNWEEHGAGTLYWRLVKCILIVLFGLALCIVGTYTSIVSLIKDVYG